MTMDAQILVNYFLDGFVDLGQLVPKFVEILTEPEMSYVTMVIKLIKEDVYLIVLDRYKDGFAQEELRPPKISALKYPVTINLLGMKYVMMGLITLVDVN